MSAVEEHDHVFWFGIGIKAFHLSQYLSLIDLLVDEQDSFGFAVSVVHPLDGFCVIVADARIHPWVRIDTDATRYQICFLCLYRCDDSQQ